MGCSSSKSIAFDTAASKLEFKKDFRDFELLHLSMSDIRKLYYVYDDILSSGMESITLAELLAHCDLPRSAFYEKVFGIFSTNQSVEIDFRSFVFCLWNFCTLNRINLGRTSCLHSDLPPAMLNSWHNLQPHFLNRYVHVRLV